MQYHKIANIFPILQKDELNELAEDIKSNGLKESIWVYDGKILDGRNRFEACKIAGIEPKYRDYLGDEPASFVLSLNAHRRHLTQSQKAASLVEALPLLEEEARKRMLSGKKIDPSEIIHEGSKGRSDNKAGELLKVSGRYVSEAKAIQKSAPELFEKIKSGEKTISEVRKEQRREARVEAVKEISKGNKELSIDKKYPVLLIDPPWQYEFSKSESREIENHYPTMTMEELFELRVSDLSTQDSVMFMWATSPKLVEAMELLKAYGFEYVTNAVWVKDKIGMGYYFRQQHEILLVGKRGNLPVSQGGDRVSSVIEAPRGKHSSKPEIVHEIIEKMYPEYEKIEIFSRSKRNNWDSWGNQA